MRANTDVSSSPPAWHRRSFTHHVPVVLNIVRELVCFDGAEARAPEVLAGLLLPPHGSQSLTVLRQRNGHAVHAGDGIKQSTDRMLTVLVNMAGTADILHQVYPVRRQCAVDAPEHVERLGLVMHGVEGGDELERLGLGGPVEVGEID